MNLRATEGYVADALPACDNFLQVGVGQDDVRDVTREGVLDQDTAPEISTRRTAGSRTPTSAAVTTPDSPTAAASGESNAADVTFLQQMIPHHE